MADAPDKESKTEEATEKKVRETLEKGNTPVSREISIFASFVAILIFAIFFAEQGVASLGMFLSNFLDRPEEWRLATAQDAMALYRIVGLELAKTVGVALVLFMASGIIASVLQNTPAIVLDRIAPKLSRISLSEGWSRLFGVAGWVEFLKSLGKIGAAGVFLFFTMRHVKLQILSGMITETTVYGGVIRDIAIHILMSITFVMLVIAGADLFWSRFKWRRDLRMTHQEVKDELKQTDGDPLVKARIRSVQRDRARRRMMAAVPKATLVIANPTHLAIALRYVRDETAAPIVVAKGQDLLALRIRAIAEESGVPVFEDVALARSMYRQVSVDSMIPVQFYQAVAELVRVVYAKQPPMSGRGTATQ